MGGRGGTGTRNTEPSIEDQVRNYYEELNTRNYGKVQPAGNMNPERKEEFRRVFTQIINHYKNYPEDLDKTYYPASGFTYYSKNPEKYSHSTQKLNQYANILRNEVRGVGIELRLGVIDETRAKLELKTLKSMDALIKNRRDLLKGLR